MTVGEFNQCVDLYSDNIYRFLLKNTRDADLAKDLVQDSYEKLWARVTEVSFTKAKSYLFTTAYHCFIDMIRREKFRGTMDEVNLPDHIHNDQYSDLNEMLHKALEKLPEVQRSVVLLRDYEGYSYEEIAEITGLSDAQVKVYIFRGRLFLKNYIGKLETVI
jgi:RNA polymerase sigma factor (sigma-70 family)